MNYFVLCRLTILLAMAYCSLAHADDFLKFERTQLAIDMLVSDYGMDRELVTKWMSQGKYHKTSVTSAAAPAEKTKSYAQYRPMFLSWDTIWQGRRFLAKYDDWLLKAETDYGVPQEIIVSIIGIESRYGLSKGRHRTFDALGSLAVTEGRRADYFLREWVKFIAFIYKQGIDPLDMKGSYAGATGYAQFMPTSYEAYAVDLDADGDIDIWNDPIDAIGSVANYLKQNGWKTGQPIVSKAKVAELNPELTINTLSRDRKLANVLEAGWKIESLYENDWYVFPIRLEAKDGPQYWLGYRNFWSISRYNRSISYAMAVYQLAEEIANSSKEVEN